MAKKKKEEIETKELKIDVSQLSLENEKYIGDLAKYIEENMADVKVVRDGSSLILTIPANISNKKVKEIVKRFVYLADLTQLYRVISLSSSEEKGFMVHKRRLLE
ncbi:MAG: hypothetical protein ACTSU2_15950 [Promethearchaeota archaeon]